MHFYVVRVFLSLGFFSLLFSCEHDTSSKTGANARKVRVSAFFDNWSSNFAGAMVILPNGEKKDLRPQVGKAVPVTDDYEIGSALEEVFRYQIFSHYVDLSSLKSHQEELCRGTIPKTATSLQLRFTKLPGTDPKSNPPWFSCKISAK
jgi:hypothetical protein